MSASINEPKNILLNALNLETKRRLLPHLELVKLKQGSVIAESDDIMKNVYFPIDSSVSLSFTTKDGDTNEISLVGNEGFVGIAVFMKGGNLPSRAVVKSSGYAYRLSSRKFKEELCRNGDLQESMLRHIQVLLTDMAHAAAGESNPLVNQQLCEFLMLMLDRLTDNDLLVTQEIIASMQETPNDKVVNIAAKQQQFDVIEYSRGSSKTWDRTLPKNRSFECYTLIKKDTDYLLPQAFYAQDNVYRFSA